MEIDFDDLYVKSIYKILYERKVSPRIMLRIVMKFDLSAAPHYILKYKNKITFESQDLRKVIDQYNNYELICWKWK